jgi:hypothetical protein
MEFEQTVVVDAKKAMDPNSDGGVRITKAEAQCIRQKAVNRVYAYLGDNGVDDIIKVLGFADRAALGQFITGKIEQAVLNMKLGKEWKPWRVLDLGPDKEDETE